MTGREELARRIATGLGYNFDKLFASKREWTDARGMRDGIAVDINEPRKPDFLDAADAVLRWLSEDVQVARMVTAVRNELDECKSWRGSSTEAQLVVAAAIAALAGDRT